MCMNGVRIGKELIAVRLRLIRVDLLLVCFVQIVVVLGKIIVSVPELLIEAGINIPNIIGKR